MDEGSLTQQLRAGIGIAAGVYLLLLAGSALLAAYQVAVISVRRSRLTQLVEAGHRSARLIEPLVDHPESFMVASRLALIAASAAATVLFAAIGVALAGLVEGADSARPAGETVTQAVVRMLPAVVGFAVLGQLFYFLLGDALPRAHAARHEEPILLAWAWPMTLFTKLMWPFVGLVGLLGRSVMAVAGVPFGTGRRARSEEEIKVLVEGSAEEGILEPEEKEMIHSIIRFTDTTVRQIMVPRIDMTVAEVDMPLGAVVDVVLKEGHTRLPVYQENVDNIIGIVHAKDLLRPLLEGKPDFPLTEVLRTPYYVPEGKKVDELLHEFRREQTQLAIVVDEYGGTSGLVTIEDILEEIVGDIADEYDVEEPLVQPLGDNAYLLDARLSIEDANEQLELSIPAGEYETIGGFVFGQLGRLPEVGEVVQFGPVEFIVHETDGHRIEKIHLVRTDRAEEAPSAEEDVNREAPD
jgi:CBS domain containing-hemolysin-like protein